METNTQNNLYTLGVFIHLSTFSKYIIPFGNFIIPVILWLSKKNESSFIDDHGRRAVNFQISVFIYSVMIVLFAIPFIIWQAIAIADDNGFYSYNSHIDSIFTLSEITGLAIIIVALITLLLGLFILELVTVIAAAIAASQGKEYQYPLTINFIKASPQYGAATPA